jgi:hypothetical protein
MAGVSLNDGKEERPKYIEQECPVYLIGVIVNAMVPTEQFLASASVRI